MSSLSRFLGDGARRRRVLAIGAAATALIAAGGASAQAATSTFLAGQLTSPFGAVQLGSGATAGIWVADHAQGFCRLDPATQAIVAATCNLSAGAQGGTSVNAAHTLAFVADSGSKGQGVWRHSLSNAAGTRVRAQLLANRTATGQQLAPLRVDATAVSPGGNVYVGAKRSGDIFRITGADNTTSPGILTDVGPAVGARKVLAMGFVGPDLWFVDGAGLEVLPNPDVNCPGVDCIAEPAGVDAVGGTTAVAGAPDIDPTTGAQRVDPVTGPVFNVYLGGIVGVSRYNTGDATQDDAYFTSGTLPGGASTTILNVSGISIDAANNVLVTDDTSGGAQVFTGRAWSVTPQ